MVNKYPKNIVEWTLPRSGSTHLLKRITAGLYLTSQDKDTRNLQEATGLGGIFRQWLGISSEVDFGELFNEDPITDRIICDYMKWIIDETGKLTYVDFHGDPLNEPQSRADLLKHQTWRNPIAVKNMRWSSESSNVEKLDALFSDAVLNSEKEDFYHVALWRRDPFDMMTSRLIMVFIKQAHGVYHWDGQLFGIRKESFVEKFSETMLRFFRTYRDTVMSLPLQKTVMIETKQIDSTMEFVWPDGTHLPLPTEDQLKSKQKKREAGKAVYINTITGETVKPRDMLGPKTLTLCQRLADQIEAELSWSTLDQQFARRTV